MRVWLLKAGEPLPMVTGRSDRLLRTGLIARELAARDVDVTWWSSTWDHSRKMHLAERSWTAPVSPNYRVELLHGIAYSANISLPRIVNHLQIARAFRVQARQRARPDIILAALPTLELAREAARYGSEMGVPVVVDLRDMWPDIILDTAPRGMRTLARALLQPMFADAAYACRTSTAITGITEDFVDWGLRYAKRERRPADRAFPLAYAPPQHSDDAIAAGTRYWHARSVGRESGEFIACFFGSIGPQFRHDVLLDAARRLTASGRRITFVLCGNGDQLDSLRERARNQENVILPGWVGQQEIAALMRMASVGLAPYRDTYSFRMSIPNKVSEYFSAGLPIVSGLSGRVQELLSTEQVGLSYRDDDAAGLAQQLARVYDEPALRRSMSERAAQLFARRFSAAAVYGSMADYLLEIAANAA